MKTVILAGGLGTRLSEETVINPKPMVRVGGMPVLWHIMKIYAAYGYNEFVAALGYKNEVIKGYFADYYRLRSDLSIHTGTGLIDVHGGVKDDWLIHLIDTGLNTNTGGRIKRLSTWLAGETFMLTYGDGVANVDIAELVKFHKKQGRLATVTAVRPPARFGGLSFKDGLVDKFTEKPQIGEGWINGGFFVLEPDILDYIEDDQSSFEKDTLEKIAADGQLAAFKHEDFWQCMDTLRDVSYLNELWESNASPWKVW